MLRVNRTENKSLTICDIDISQYEIISLIAFRICVKVVLEIKTYLIEKLFSYGWVINWS